MTFRYTIQIIHSGYLPANLYHLGVQGLKVGIVVVVNPVVEVVIDEDVVVGVSQIITV